ncbi:MAG: MarR family transcriptional regulator, partial [Bacteroidota bacterium]
RFNISLTKEGKEKVANILPIVQEYRRLGWSGLSEPDYTKLREILGIIQRNFKEEGGSSSP